MKIYFRWPGGAEFTFEREPMPQDKLVAICVTIGAVALIIGFFGMIAAVAG